jgi:hypothetical protein
MNRSIGNAQQLEQVFEAHRMIFKELKGKQKKSIKY